MFWQRTEKLRLCSQLMFEHKYHRDVMPYVVDALYEAGGYQDEVLADSILSQLNGDYTSQVAKPFLYEFARLVEPHSEKYEFMSLLGVGKLNHMVNDVARSILGIYSFNFIFLWGIPIGCHIVPGSRVVEPYERLKLYFLHKFQLFDPFVTERSFSYETARYRRMYIIVPSDPPFSLSELSLVEKTIVNEQPGTVKIARLATSDADKLHCVLERSSGPRPVHCWINKHAKKRFEAKASIFFKTNVRDLQPLGAY